MKQKEKENNWNLSEKIDGVAIEVDDVKEFIRQTIEDASKTFNYSRKKVDFLDRLRRRAGDKLNDN
jgi:hypothetical protein